MFSAIIFSGLRSIVLSLFFAAASFSVQGQDTSRLQVSLLTCTPGEELYSTFGHSALRVVDSVKNTDYIFNYGTFMFDDDFYIKFMKGKLDYFLSVDETANFIQQYQYEKRGITEQVLNLSVSEKNNLYQLLKNNIKEENKYYKYDFFYDNCTTRLRDLLQKQTDTTIYLPPVMPAGTTFRSAIHFYLDKGNMHWSKLGIDILLGYPCDAVMKKNEDGFLPYNLLQSLDTVNTSLHLVKSEKDLYNFVPLNKGEIIFTPFVIFGLLALAIIALGFIRNKFIRLFHTSFGVLHYFLTGLLGILLIIMWTATDHAMCRNNFNLLWAWPTHVMMAFFYNSKKSWVKKYFGFNALVMLLLLAGWYWLPQQLNTALIPFAVLQLFYSAKKYFKQ